MQCFFHFSNHEEVYKFRQAGNELGQAQLTLGLVDLVSLDHILGLVELVGGI